MTDIIYICTMELYKLYLRQFMSGAIHGAKKNLRNHLIVSNLPPLPHISVRG